MKYRGGNSADDEQKYPMTRSSAPRPRWGLSPHFPIIGSRYCARHPPLFLPDPPRVVQLIHNESKQVGFGPQHARTADATITQDMRYCRQVFIRRPMTLTIDFFQLQIDHLVTPVPENIPTLFRFVYRLFSSLKPARDRRTNNTRNTARRKATQ